MPAPQAQTELKSSEDLTGAGKTPSLWVGEVVSCLEVAAPALGQGVGRRSSGYFTSQKGRLSPARKEMQ